MKIIFLDIDGVLNAEDEQYEGAWRLSTAAILRVNSIVQRTGAAIVLTSDWRRYHGVQRCAEVLAAHGLRADIVDATPNLENRRTVHEDDFDPTEYFARLRRSEIEAWLASHDVEAFVVVDDVGGHNSATGSGQPAVRQQAARRPTRAAPTRLAGR
jgi:hypothetical protein